MTCHSSETCELCSQGEKRTELAFCLLPFSRFREKEVRDVSFSACFAATAAAARVTATFRCRCMLAQGCTDVRRLMFPARWLTSCEKPTVCSLLLSVSFRSCSCSLSLASFIRSFLLGSQRLLSSKEITQPFLEEAVRREILRQFLACLKGTPSTATQVGDRIFVTKHVRREREARR